MTQHTAIFNLFFFNLFFFNPQGDYRFSWRYPVAPGKAIFTLKYYADPARRAEAVTRNNIFQSLKDQTSRTDSKRIKSTNHSYRPHLYPIRSANHYSSQRFSNRLALTPPNPKPFDRA